MFLNQTTNYGLTQWEATDRILMEDFNRDNTKTDAALKENADSIAALETAVAGRGNCRIVYGSYMGSGQAGQSSPCTLTFNGKPLAVFIMSQTHSSNTWFAFLPMIRGAQWAAALSQCNVTWSDNAVSWYCVENSTQSQFSAGTQYYIAFLAADE